MRIAKRDDWNTEPFPSLYKNIELKKVYSREEFDKIAVGLVPEEMEDKWFIYYESPWLYLHRSWTGYCIYQVCFEIEKDNLKIIEVRVNQEPEQYAKTSDRWDAQLLEILLDSLAGLEVKDKIINHIKSCDRF